MELFNMGKEGTGSGNYMAIDQVDTYNKFAWVKQAVFNRRDNCEKN